jgi:two-component system LytT family response regulator
MEARSAKSESVGRLERLRPDVQSVTRVLIVEDDPDLRRAYRTLFESEPDMEVVGEAASGAEGLEAVKRLVPDLVFLDIELPDINGIELVRRAGVETFPAVIFVTGYPEYAAEAFQVEAFDYIVKPFTDQRFRSTLDRIRRRLRKDGIQDLSDQLSTLLSQVQTAKTYPQRLWIRSRGQVLVLNVDEIEWIEADAKYSIVHQGATSHRLREPISRIEARLDPSRFSRVHRSAIVNLDRVVEVVSSGGNQSIVLEDGSRIPMSRSQRLRVFELAGDES